jgi:hypothetical protein
MTKNLGTPWTAEDRRVLRDSYLAGGISAARAALPDRTEMAIYHVAQKMKLVRRRRWTRADDRELADLWGEMSVAKTAKRIGRTVLATYFRAQHLKLPLGVTQGREYLTTSANRLGFDVSQLRQILAWAGVRILSSMGRPTGAKRTYHVVDKFDATDAVERWLKTETIESAARARGVCAEVLRGILLAAGEKPPRKKKKHWRVPTETLDRLMALRNATESVSQGALRVGVMRQTLVLWLHAAGVERGTSKVWRVSKETVDDVVKARRARVGSRAPRRAA